MKNKFGPALLALSLAGVMATGAHAQFKAFPNYSSERWALSPAEHHFLYEASQDNMLEVELGRYAAQNGTMSRVRSFGRIMVLDHSKAGEWINCYAAERRIDLPDMLDAQHLDTYVHLTSQTGAAFDTAYIAAMKDDHNMGYQMYQDADRNSYSWEIRGYAHMYAPIIQEHMNLINDIDSMNKM